MCIRDRRDSLRDTPVLLTFDDDRVDNTSAIVDGDEAHEVDCTGCGIYFDHRGVYAVGIRGTVLVDVGTGAEVTGRYKGRDVRRQRSRFGGRMCDFEPRNG